MRLDQMQSRQPLRMARGPCRRSADAKLFRKGHGKEAKLCFMGHALMENRNGLVVGGSRPCT